MQITAICKRTTDWFLFINYLCVSSTYIILPFSWDDTRSPTNLNLLPHGRSSRGHKTAAYPTCQKAAYPTCQNAAYPTCQKAAYPTCKKAAYPTCQKAAYPAYQWATRPFNKRTTDHTPQKEAHPTEGRTGKPFPRNHEMEQRATCSISKETPQACKKQREQDRKTHHQQLPTSAPYHHDNNKPRNNK